MVKRVNLTTIYSLILIVLLSASIHAQVLESNETTTESSSNTSKRFSFVLSWDGKRLGVIAETGKKHSQSSSGVVVKDVIKNTAADRAGIKIGDTITEVDGKPIKSMGTLRSKILSLDYGTEYTMKIMRAGSSQDIKFTLEESADDDAYFNYYGDQAASALTTLQNKIKKSIAGSKPVRTPKVGFSDENKHNHLGVAVEKLSEQLSLYFGAGGGGILVSSVVAGSVAETAGFKAGDCIIAVNGVAILDVGTFNREVRKSKSSQITFSIVRDHQQIELQATP
jgi:serine protease Do